MRVLITAGPTREYIDAIRFISNASSGRMGCAVAEAALRAGHEAVLLLGRGATAQPPVCALVRFDTVEELKAELASRFGGCDALVMAAAVGDFRPERPFAGKLSRSGGPITIRLIPTDDILAAVAAGKRSSQTVVAFAVEDGPPDRTEMKARAKMEAKNADCLVVNTPEAMSGSESVACILSRAGIALPWGRRPKQALAAEIVRLLENRAPRAP